MRTLKAFFLMVVVAISCSPSADIETYAEHFHNETRAIKSGEFSVTYFGVSSLLFDDGNTKLLIDGFLSRPSANEVVFTKLSSDKAFIDPFLEEQKLSDINALLVNHTHYDHALDAAYIASKTSAKLYGSASAMNLGKGENLSEDKLIEFEAGDQFLIGDFKVNVIAGKHSPTKILNADLGEIISEPLVQPARFSAYKEGGTFDFLITRGQLSVYVKASPNFIPCKLDGIEADVLFLATGSIGTKKKAFIQQYYDETVGALKPKVVIPIHWDNFLLSDIREMKMMPYYMDRAKKTFSILKQGCSDDNIDLKILKGYAKIIFAY